VGSFRITTHTYQTAGIDQQRSIGNRSEQLNLRACPAPCQNSTLRIDNAPFYEAIPTIKLKKHAPR